MDTRFRLPGSAAEALRADARRETSQRLQVLGLVVMALWVVYYILGTLVLPRIGNVADAPTGHGRCLGGFLTSLALFALARSGRIGPTLLMYSGLVFMVVISGFIASFNATREIQAGNTHPVRISWICIWILLYPMIVPNKRHHIFAAAAISALLDPLFFFIAWNAKGQTFPVSHLLHWIDNYICALLAVVPAHVLEHMSRKVRRARELGSYQLTELLGRGGMGEVWQAKHSLLARPAAIKIIRAEKLGMTDSRAERMTLRRFEREAQATAALQSPHTIQVFDFGLGRDGTFYYVMELLAGFDLGTLVKRFGPLSSGRVAHLLAQACHSLYDAHESGLVHRDVKPANLFVCRMGQDYDFVKVLDFGLVRSESAVDGDSAATVHGMTTGTPGYMAPEQIRGARTLDGRVDVYSLGCVGYWLLTGNLVFDADSGMQMLIRHVQEPPELPSKRTEVRVDPQLEAAILACLEKEPEARPATARELAERLRECAAWSDWDAERAEQWWRRHAPESVPPAAQALEPVQNGDAAEGVRSV
jgi:serine/threonine-protein kinase